MQMQQEPTKTQPSRFRISKHSSGYYQVSIPNYHGGEVVEAGIADTLAEALRAVAPSCDFIINRDTGGRCGEVAIAAGSFGLCYCREHKGDREPVEVGLKVEAALSAVQE